MSAAEIGAKVEFPGELDIGVRLGQRLLDARAALGGRYSDLAQVNAVPLIGPERFTEICAAALGLSLGAGLQAGFGQIMELAGSVDKLQQRLAALEGTTGRVHLDLTASPQPAWLGQPLQIVAYVRDPQGRPLPDRQVTLEASTGTLEAAYGFAVQRSRAVTVRTGADGSARLTLRAHTIEPLTADQQAALGNALDQLDASADGPESAAQLVWISPPPTRTSGSRPCAAPSTSTRASGRRSSSIRSTRAASASNGRRRCPLCAPTAIPRTAVPRR